MSYYGMWLSVIIIKTDVSEELIASIFKVWNSSLADFSTLEKGEIHSSE
jgi:hypothetical protein